MQFSENRKIAFVVLAVCALASIFGLGGMGLARERGSVLAVYDRGADTSLSTRHSVDAYLDSASESARLMASEGQLHLKDSQVQLADSVEELAGRMDAAQDTGERYEAYTALKSAVDKLYNAMYGAVKGSDYTNFKVAYDDFWENENKIKHDDYIKLAAGYNGLISGFPGGVVAKLSGQSELSTFGG